MVRLFSGEAIFNLFCGEAVVRLFCGAAIFINLAPNLTFVVSHARR